MRLLIDASSILWAAILVGKDDENGYEVDSENAAGDPVKRYINSADYGYENFVTMYRKILQDNNLQPIDTILVQDGHDSRSMRQRIFPGYKGKRGKRPHEMYTEFNKLNHMVSKVILDLGGQVVLQHGMEADDVLAALATKLKGGKLIWSNDYDFLALVNDQVSFQNSRGEVCPQPYGPIPYEYITLYKSLVGDSSDNYPGVKGLGPKAFLELYMEYGDEGCDDLISMIQMGTLSNLEADIEELGPKDKHAKILQKIVDQQDMVKTCYELARFHFDKIDTLHQPLEWKAGRVVEWKDGESEPLLEEYYGEIHLVDATNYGEIKQDAADLLRQSEFCSLDLETYVPDEGDEWVKANTSKGKKLTVDTFGSEIVGMGFTFGPNQQYTLYFSHAHDNDNNLSLDQIREFLELIPKDMPIVVHNSSFELVVCYNAWGGKWEDNGFHGFLPNVQDTLHMKSYVDENTSLGLKHCSLTYLNYQQETYEEVTQGKKMNQLSAEHVLSYGADDTICTSALYNHFGTILELEGTRDIYERLEPDVAYLLALATIRGLDIDSEYLKELAEEDQKIYDQLYNDVLVPYLCELNWPGSEYEPVNIDKTNATKEVKRVFEAWTGDKLNTRVRKWEKVIGAVREQGAEDLADLLETESFAKIDLDLRKRFIPNPSFNLSSPKQFTTLLFDDAYMGLPIHLRNKISETERKKAREERREAKGSPKSDALALTYTLAYDVEENDPRVEIINALMTLKTISTRQKLFYNTYEVVPHWKDGKVHPSFGQNATNTRRFAPNKPNLAQLPKQGDGKKVRRLIIPHVKDGKIISLDESAQEMRMIADYAHDDNLTSCFIGEQLKDIHCLTALGIAQRKGHPDLDYDTFTSNYQKEVDAHKEGKWTKLRKLGKKVNFTVEYGAQAPKLAQTIMVTEEEAQLYIEAKYAQFNQVENWKQEVISEARSNGYVTTKMGARRHLRNSYTSEDKWDHMKADRRSVNVKIQGSSCEQIKQVIGDIWRNDICFKYDCNFIAPIHDEVVLSVSKPDIVDVLRIAHSYMVQPYGGMWIPIESSYSVGDNFGDQEELGEVFDAEKIIEAVS